MRLILTGVKSSGKSTVGPILAKYLQTDFVDLDDIILGLNREQGRAADTCAEIYKIFGEEEFRRLERLAVSEAAKIEFGVIATGGSTLLDSALRERLKNGSLLFFLRAPASILWSRVSAKALPPFLENEEDPQKAFFNRVELVEKVVMPNCDFVLSVEEHLPQEIALSVFKQLENRIDLIKGEPSGHSKTISGCPCCR